MDELPATTLVAGAFSSFVLMYIIKHVKRCYLFKKKLKSGNQTVVHFTPKNKLGHSHNKISCALLQSPVKSNEIRRCVWTTCLSTEDSLTMILLWVSRRSCRFKRETEKVSVHCQVPAGFSVDRVHLSISHSFRSHI